MADDFVTYTQRRWTGGIRLIDGQYNIHIDPGPGAVVRSVDAGLSIERVRLLLISHIHPDHCSDAGIFLEGMTRGTTRRRGTLVASKSVLLGNEAGSISKYHQGLVSQVLIANPGESHRVEGIRVHVTKAMHTDPEGVGYVLDFQEVGKIGYIADTGFFNGLTDPYRGVRVLILCVMRPRGAPIRGHLSTDDAREIVATARPKMAVLTHFGMRMLNDNPPVQAKYVQDCTGVETIAGLDGMIVTTEEGKVVTSLSRRGRVAPDRIRRQTTLR